MNAAASAVAPAGVCEVIHWRDAKTDPPDDETTVLIQMPGASEPVWMGYREDGRWYVIDGWEPSDYPVTRWAELPMGDVG